MGRQAARTTRSPSPAGLIIALMTARQRATERVFGDRPALPERHAILRTIFPLEFLHLSRFVTLLLGFTLVILSINIYRRKKRAMVLGIALSALSVVFHLTKGLDYEEALFSLILLVALIFARNEFRVRSGIPNFEDAVTKLGIAVALTLGYGILGFWLLDRRQFGIDFSFLQAILTTGSLLTFSPRPYLVPHTAYARWFLESFYVITLAAIVYAGVEFFRPVVYRFRTQPHEQELARRLLHLYGRSSLDYFKAWSDKSYFFSSTGRSFIAYRVAAGIALVLGDPVGPPDEINDVIQAFLRLCEENDWSPAFYQTTAVYLFHYRRLGLHKLKVGDDGFVDLPAFTLDGKQMKHLRSKVHNLERSGIRTVRFDAPVPDDILAEAKEVSDEWLRIPGRRERRFSLGRFDRNYLKLTPLFVVFGRDGRMLAFANIVPSFHPGDTTVDLMRHRSDAPNGTMDYMFIKLFLTVERARLPQIRYGNGADGRIPGERGSVKEERAVHYFLQRLNFLFSYQGLMHFKSKFATIWEPRYLIYRHVLDLPRIALAIAKVSEIRGETEFELTEHGQPRQTASAG